MSRGTTDQFAYEWARYPEILPEHEEQFLGWIAPLRPSDLAGRSILDVGCGSGRNSYWAARYGAARIVACDADERTLAVARRNLQTFPAVEVVRASADALPWSDAFDVVMAIGVVHHLDDPATAVARMVAAAKPGGTVLVWVYGREGTRGLLTLLRPVRALTARLPPAATDVVAYAFSVPLYLALRAGHHSHPYLRAMKRWGFRHVHQVVFDQLLPRIAHYWTRAEVLELFRGLPVDSIEAVETNRISWTVRAMRTAR